MGYRQNTTYVMHDDVEVVTLALDRILAREGMAPAADPPQRVRRRVEPMQYDGALDNDLWGVAVFPGATGWSVVKSAPLELLAERPAANERMRLADLCEHLGTSAFQVNVYDDGDAVLVEVSAHGEVLMSGFNGQSADPMHWNGMPVCEERIRPMFEIHPLEHLLGGALGEDLARAAADQVGGVNADYCDNLVCVDTLVCHKPFTAPGGLAVYYRWRGPSRQRHQPSDTFDQWRTR